MDPNDRRAILAAARQALERARAVPLLGRLVPTVPDALSRIPREAYRYTVGEIVQVLRDAHTTGELR